MMTTANKVTILRILLVPFFVAQLLYYVDSGKEIYRLLALLCFVVAAISDGVDGYIARRYNQRSELGAVLDPLADKLLLVAGIMLLSLNNDPYLPQLPIWLVVTILSRDVLTLIGVLIIQFIVGKVEVRPHMVGKVATVLQMVTVIWGLLKWSEGWLFYLSLATAITTGVSGVIYTVSAVRQLSASPASAAAEDQTN